MEQKQPRETLAVLVHPTKSLKPRTNTKQLKNMKTTTLLFAILAIFSHTQAQTDDWKLVWQDEFDGTTLDATKWIHETGGNGWGNNEAQYYTDGNNTTIADGKLTITARKETYMGKNYTSSRIISRGKSEFKYGRIEFRAILPAGRGSWPALWLLGTNLSTKGWPACGEIDVMEHVGYDPSKVHSALHTTSSSGNTINTSTVTVADFDKAYHNYILEWTPSKISFYIDELAFYTYAPFNKDANNWPFDNPFFMLMNIAVGGNWGGAQGIDDTIFPIKMSVDYVRVYQKDSFLGTNDLPTPSNLQIFPNPVGNKATLQLGHNAKPQQVSIYDTKGQKLQSFQANNAITEFDTSTLPQGTYIVRTSTQSAEFVK
ncbi:MAG: hypothetical protein RIS47_523 [Bacteroidota bacterium]|jgi:beta-glucanase (GH16 family)